MGVSQKCGIVRLGGDLALNSLLVVSLNLKLPRSFGGPKARDD